MNILKKYIYAYIKTLFLSSLQLHTRKLTQGVQTNQLLDSLN